MISLKQAVVVEGKYDKIKISNFVNAVIVTTDGFKIFSSKFKRDLIRFLAKKSGIVILTDSDRAGQLIRNHIKSFVDGGEIYCAYVPRVLGKDRRKAKPSKEGVLGVESMTESIILDALRKAGVFLEGGKPNRFTNLHLFEAGLLGGENSSNMRRLFLEQIGLPCFLSTKQLLEVLNSSFSFEEFAMQVDILRKNLKNL